MLAQAKWCGAQAGMLAVLHTWGSNMSFHPHLHCIVPAGGLSFCGNKWVACRKSSVLVDVQDLSKLFRQTFQKMLLEEWELQGIAFTGGAQIYEDLEAWRGLFECFQKDWIVYAKRPNAGPEQTLNYLSRYTHSVAISEGRILEIKAEKVKIEYKDYRDEDENGMPKKKSMWLPIFEFIRRFIQHILPRGFQKIRYFGIWASCNRKRKLAKSQQLLGHKPLLLTLQAIQAILKQKLGIEPGCCPHCGSADILMYYLCPRGMLSPKLQSSFSNRAPPELAAIKAA